MRKITISNLVGQLTPFLVREIMRPLHSARSVFSRLAIPRSAKPGATKPEATKPEAAKPEAAKPEAAKPEAERRKPSDAPRGSQTRQRPRLSPELDMKTLTWDFSPKRLARKDIVSISLWGAFWSAAFTVSVGVLGDAPALAALTVLAAFTSAVWYATGRRDRREEER